MWTRPKETEQRDGKSVKKIESTSVWMNFAMTWFLKGTNCRLNFPFSSVQDTVSLTWYNLGPQCSHLPLRTFLMTSWMNQTLENLFSVRVGLWARGIYTDKWHAISGCLYNLYFCSGFNICISSFLYNIFPFTSLHSVQIALWQSYPEGSQFVFQ